VSIEDRHAIRQHLADTYAKKCPTVEELVKLVSAIDEELLYTFSNSKEDYVKTGSNWEYRIEKKNKELAGTLGVAGFLKSVTSREAAVSFKRAGQDEIVMEEDPVSPNKKRTRKN
jgi:4-hydroxyphenylpyruvate dioxygenase-like putative hemolysin